MFTHTDIAKLPLSIRTYAHTMWRYRIITEFSEEDGLSLGIDNYPGDIREIKLARLSQTSSVGNVTYSKKILRGFWGEITTLSRSLGVNDRDDTEETSTLN